MTKYCNIKDLVLHINAKFSKAFQGTRYEETYLFYHDALTTMTDKDCIDWMEEKGILKRWIHPVLGLNDLIIVKDGNGNEESSKNYVGRPLGDCPEAMPLDNSLL